MKMHYLLATAAAALIASTQVSAANLIVNGNFETGTFAGWTKSGNTSLSDIIANNVTSNHTNVWRSGATGSQAFISQDIVTSIGSTYALTFDFFNSATSNSLFTVDFGGSQIYSLANIPHDWGTPLTFNLVATSALTTVRFGARNDPSFTRVDDISLNLVAAPSVPEPATWAMMIGGLGAVGATLRRRKVAVSFA